MGKTRFASLHFLGLISRGTLGAHGDTMIVRGWKSLNMNTHCLLSHLTSLALLDIIYVCYRKIPVDSGMKGERLMSKRPLKRLLP